ncbi:MAG: HD domain-containing protein [Deltaproteobacteria bacterium]|nr:HD domain-containing protein [Deltaproteobacteria bacterium]
MTVPAILLGLVCLAVLVYFLVSLHRLNRVASALRKGDGSVDVPLIRFPFLKEASQHYRFFHNAVSDLNHLEKYQQRMHAYEKKEMEHILEKEDLSRQLEKQLKEVRNAHGVVSGLNTDMEKKNRSLNEAINRLSALNQISRMLGIEHDRREIYRMLVALPRELMGAEIGHILLYDRDKDEMVMEYSQGLKESPGDRRRVKVGNGMAGWVAKNKKPLLVKDFSSQDFFSATSSIGYRRKTAISAPIMIRDDLIGVITLINKDNGQPFVEAERTLLATMTSEAAMALHNVLLLEKVQKSYFAMVQSLITAVEAKDVYTRGHSERVTQYSLLIAEQMNFPLDRMEIIQQAGVLHDIGKITVELAILNKPTGLNPDEYRKIQIHPDVGYRILQPIDFNETVKLAVLQHHERPDGKGYPNGYRSDQILLEARILAAADAFDAMTTKRPYRDPLSLDAAMKEMENCVGTQFDPEVVAVLRKIVDAMASSGAMASMYA